MMDHLDAGVKPSTRGDDVAHVTSADALRNVAFPEGALRPPLQVQWLLLAFLCLRGQGVFLAVISPITVDLAELQVRGQVRALDLKWCTLPVVLWCNKSSCTVLFIALTMCCRNRVQSQLSIWFLIRGEVQSLHGSPGPQLTSGETGGSFSQEKCSFAVEQSLADMVENRGLICS